MKNNAKAIIAKAMKALEKQALLENEIQQIKGGNSDDPIIDLEPPIIWGMVAPGERPH